MSPTQIVLLVIAGTFLFMVGIVVGLALASPGKKPQRIVKTKVYNYHRHLVQDDPARAQLKEARRQLAQMQTGKSVANGVPSNPVAPMSSPR